MAKLSLRLKLLAGSLVLLAGSFLLSPEVTGFEKFKASYPLSQKYLFSSDARLVSELRDDYKKKNIAWFSLDRISPDFLAKLLKQEDHRFYRHPGVDPLAVGQALKTLAQGGHRGASTISMQLAKNMFGLNTRSVTGKLKQMLLALKIEARWSKNEILEAYLNLIYLHGEIQGIGTASLALFNKSPLYLNESEQQTLLKLIKSPNSLLGAPLYRDESVHLAEHYQRYLVKTGRFNALSELNFGLQEFAVQTVKNHVARIRNKNVHDAAVIVLDNRSGKVLAYVGGNPETSQSPYVDMAQAERQMGSTLKPFLYATALDAHLIQVSSWIEDSPLDIIFPNGTYSPKNHDQHFHGWVHVGTALGSSLNVPAVKMIQLTGVENFWNTLQKLNFNLEHDPDFYGPSLALGVLDGSLWQLTHAYQSFVNGRIFTPDTREKLIWMLSRSQNRALSFGQDSLLSVAQGFAVKTGTSKDMKDNWAVGFNRDFTVGVWVGNSDSSSMENVLGVTGAGPIWREVVDYLLTSRLGSNTPLLAADSDSKFLAEENSAVAGFSFHRGTILSPANDSIYAIDPSIPLKFQKIILEADGDQKNLRWKYNGEFLQDTKLTLKKGRQKIELYSGGTKTDESTFLVK